MPKIFRDTKRVSFSLVVIIIALTACGQYVLRDGFEKSIDRYNEMVRWHKFDEASLFTTESLSEEFGARVKAAKNVKVIDYRIVKTKYDGKKGEAEVRVEIDYYTLSTNRLKTLLDIQKWAYFEENGTKQWRLVSLLPEFP